MSQTHLSQKRSAAREAPRVGCGKTTLAQSLAQGAPPGRPRSTVGCNVYLRLLEQLLGASGAATGERPGTSGKGYIVELWDLGTQERYRSLWPLFLRGINGIILVHDLSLPGAIKTIPTWAEYVAAHATYSAPLADEFAAANLGRLAVPYLIVGSKADMQSSRSQHLRVSQLLIGCCRRLWLYCRCRLPLSGLTSAPSRSRETHEDFDLGGESVSVSALRGCFESDAFDEFFTQCILRRPKKGMSQQGAVVGRDAVDLSPKASLHTFRGSKKSPMASVGDCSKTASPSATIEWSDLGRIDDTI